MNILQFAQLYQYLLNIKFIVFMNIIFCQEYQREDSFKLQLYPSSLPAHQYYCSYETQIGKTKMNAFKLVGAANPRISLLQLYRLFAAPAQHTINRSFILFTISCYRKYKSLQCEQLFKKQFFPYKSTENKEVTDLVDRMGTMSEDQLDTLQKQTLKKPTEVKAGITQIHAQKQFRKLEIVPQGIKMKQLGLFADRLNKLWGIKILLDKFTNTYPFKHSLIALEQFLSKIQISHKLTVPGVQIVQNLCLSLCKQLADLNQHWQSEYPLSFNNVYLQVRTNGTQMALGQNCCFNYLQPILSLLGLQNKPTTLQNFLLFNATPRPEAFCLYFKDILKSTYEISKQSQMNRIQATIKWLLICDHLMGKVFKQSDSLTVIQKFHNDRKGIISDLITKKEYIQTHTKGVIALLELQLKELNEKELVRALSLNSIYQMLAGSEESSSKNKSSFMEEKYGLMRSSLSFRNKLFFEKQSLRHFCSNTSISKAKRLCLYLFAKYALLHTQLQFLDLWSGESMDLLNPTEPSSKYIANFIKVCDKINGDLSGVTQQIKSMHQPQSFFELFKKLNELQHKFSFKNDQYKSRMQSIQQAGKHLKQIKSCLDGILDLFKSSYSTAAQSNKGLYMQIRKNMCFKEIFLNLNFYNHADLFHHYSRIVEYNQVEKDSQIESLRQYYDGLEQQISEAIGKQRQLFSSTSPLPSQQK